MTEHPNAPRLPTTDYRLLTGTKEKGPLTPYEVKGPFSFPSSGGRKARETAGEEGKVFPPTASRLPPAGGRMICLLPRRGLFAFLSEEGGR